MATQGTAQAEFKRESLEVQGVRVAMLTAGAGGPLVFFHGAGTWHGFDFALPWASGHRVIVPYHPGWGDSADAAGMTTVDDYMLHYLDMFDQLGLGDPIDLVGLSMGGRFAATFAAQHRERIRKLVLVAPAGLDVPEHPIADLSKIPAEDVNKYLVEDFSVIANRLPQGPDPAFQAARVREGVSFFRLIQTGLIGDKLPRWLHRINVPTLILWGEKDRIIPIGQAEVWRKLIPNSQVRRIPGAGHLVLDEKAEAVQAITDFLAG